MKICDKTARFTNGFYSILLHNAINYIMTPIFLYSVALLQFLHQVFRNIFCNSSPYKMHKERGRLNNMVVKLI